MKILGYIFPDGTVLCARHATDVHDEGIEMSEVQAITSSDSTPEDIVCAVPKCGIILLKTYDDGSETYGYGHYLYYDDETGADFALRWVRVEYDEDAEIQTDEQLSAYDYAVTFATEHELSDEQAQQLFQITKPDAYDLNVSNAPYEDDEDDDDLSELTGFPEVFTERERSAARALAEEELTIEYIDRLERIARAAFDHYTKNESYGFRCEPLTGHALYEALSSVSFMQE